MKTTPVTVSKLKRGDVMNLFGVNGDVRDVVVILLVQPDREREGSTVVWYRFLGEEAHRKEHWLSNDNCNVILSIGVLL